MKTVIIMQARMTSTRLPGKVLLPILGHPMMAYQIERMLRSQMSNALVVATTLNVTDDPIVDHCRSAGIQVTRGSEHDVLSRYHEAACASSADIVVRVTSDCPLLEPELVDMAIRMYRDHAESVDYVSNMIVPTWPYGMAVEVFSAATLAEAAREARDPAEREHVTPFIYWRPERYRLKSLERAPDLSGLRLTVDTPEDFELIRRILEALFPVQPAFKLNDVVSLLDSHPDWLRINESIVQKTANPQLKDSP